MKSKLINVLVFTVGAAVGSAVTWKVLKTKYDRIVQEEIESIKDAFAGNEPDVAQEQTDDVEDDDEYTYPDGTVKQIKWEDLEDLKEEDDESQEYGNLVDNYISEKGGAKQMGTDPYIISPYDFGELDDYEQVELTYYEGDDTLEDEDYKIVTNRDELIGPKALYTFGEYEEDSVFVRNDRLRTDFQILKDYRKYSEARSAGPNRVGDE